MAGKIQQMLRQRHNHAREVTLEELRQGLSRVIYLFHDELYLKLPDPAFIQRLAEWDDRDAAAATLFQSWAYGVRLRLMVHRQLLHSLPLQALARMPLKLEDHRRKSVQLITHECVTWSDLVQINNCLLLVSKRAFITAMACELLEKNNISLIRQE
ncbi:PduM family microcompartment protein [Shigella flexneri]|nr:PduM family microcompartment protein [Escherichia coli]